MGPQRFAKPCVIALAVTLLGGCPTVDLGATPSDIGQCNPKGGLQYFQDQIWPNYIQNNGNRSCIDTTGACHAENGGNVMTFKTMPVNYSANYKSVQIQLNCNTPDASLFLTKPLANIEDHTGGPIFADENVAAVKTFLAWFQ